MTAGRLKTLCRIRNAVVHYCGTGGLVYSVKNKIYTIEDLAQIRPVCVAEVPWRGIDLICHLRLADRALKRSILQVHESTRGSLLVCNGRSWWSIEAQSGAVSIPRFSGTRPMNRGICTSPSEITYVADYTANDERHDPVRIYASRTLKSFEAVWEFPAGDIRHIHALIPDPEDLGRIWVLTGDEDSECRILYTDDGFESVRTFLASGQRTRATDLIIRDQRLIWGMDSPLESSWLLSVDKKNPEDIIKLIELPGPVYYLGQNAAGAVYAGTTVEPGPAVRDNYGRIFGSSPEGDWMEIMRRRNDPFPQRGIFYFPRGTLPGNYLVFSQRALMPQEGCLTIAVDLAWPDEP